MAGLSHEHGRKAARTETVLGPWRLWDQEGCPKPESWGSQGESQLDRRKIQGVKVGGKRTPLGPAFCM